MKRKDPYNTLKWSARISGSLIVAFTLFIGIGEIIEGQQRNTGLTHNPYSILLLAIFIIWGIALAGLVLALWKEGLGGAISLIGFMLVYILNLFNKEATMRGSAITLFLFFSIPAIIYLVYWKLSKDEAKKVNIDP
jgi:hypothetical protein